MALTNNNSIISTLYNPILKKFYDPLLGAHSFSDWGLEIARNSYFTQLLNQFNQLKEDLQNPSYLMSLGKLNTKLEIPTSTLGASATSGAKSTKPGAWGKGGAGWAAVGAAANALGRINTGDPRGMWDTMDPFYHLADGKESTVGNALSDTGVALTQAGISSGNGPLALAGAATKIFGGLTNAAFGVKENKKNIEYIKNNTNLARKVGSGFGKVSTSDELLSAAGRMTGGSGFKWGDLYENGWFTSAGTEKGNNLIRLEDSALAYQNNALGTGALSVDKTLDDNTMANFTAFGGPIDVDPSTPIGYSIYTDKFVKDKLKDSSGMTNMFAGTPSIFGFGGGIYTKGANFDTGVSFINKGGTHEENPNDGVQMGVDSQGVPNLVEEGEVNWEDYIFSDRLIVPRGKRGNYGKRARKYAEGGKLAKGKGIDTPYESKVLKPYEGLTFADAAKKILKRNGADERHDAITMRGVNAQLSVLAGILEKEREKEKLREMLETIDNMSPEEFAMLQQLMEAQLAALQLQEMAMLQQQMIPEGMELMVPQEQIAAAYGGPIYGLGGLLNNWDVQSPATEDVTKYDEGGDLNTPLYNEWRQRVFGDMLLSPNLDNRLQMWYGSPDPDLRDLSVIMKENFSPESYEAVYNSLAPQLRELLESDSFDDGIPQDKWPDPYRQYREMLNAKSDYEKWSRRVLGGILVDPTLSGKLLSWYDNDKEIGTLSDILKQDFNPDVYRAITSTLPEDLVLLIENGQYDSIKPEEWSDAYRLYINNTPDNMHDSGGILNIPNNVYSVGGPLNKFKAELKKSGITLEDYYIAYLIANLKLLKGSEEEQIARNLFRQAPEVLVNDDNFDEEFAKTFLNRVETITKQYNRRAKRQGIKTDNLLGASKAQYNRDLNKAILKGITNADYDITLDADLTLNNPNIAKAKNKQQAYSNAATYDDLIARGGRVVELDNQGRPRWQSMLGLNRIDNSGEGFYDNLGIYEDAERERRGIYDYGEKEIYTTDADDFNNIKLYGWKRGEDGNYAIDKSIVNPNEASKLAGKSKSTYKISDLGTKEDGDYLTYGLEGYKEALDNIQDNADYDAQTLEVLSAMKNEDGTLKNFKDIPKRILNYLRYLDKNSANEEDKLLIEDAEGNTQLNPGSDTKLNAADLYEDRRMDWKYGIYHYLYGKENVPLATRYYYMDNGKPVYILKPSDGFTVSGSPTINTVGNTTFNDYEVTGLNKKRTLTQLPTGEVVDVTDLADLPNWKKLDKPILVDNTDNLGYGIKGTTDWVDYGSSPMGQKVIEDENPFPKPSNWPFALAAGLQLGSLGYNILKPTDYSHADALLKAAKDAGLYKPVEFRPIGNYLPYKPLDIWYEQNRLTANARATDRAILNSGANQGSKAAALLASGYNNQLASGNLFRQALEYNDALRKQTGEFNKDTDKFNSEGFLKADMANQDAASRAAGYTLEGKKAAYTMMLAMDDAKANAITAGLSGLANLAYNYGTNKDQIELLKWMGKTGANGPISMSKYGAQGGRIRRKKGLSF